MEEIGAALARARLARGESQRQVAERIGAHPQTIARIEKGVPGVSAGSLLALLHMYGAKDLLWKLADDTEQTQRLAMRAATGSGRARRSTKE